MGMFWDVIGFVAKAIGVAIYIVLYNALPLLRTNLLISFFYAFCDLVIGEAEHRTIVFFWLLVSVVIDVFGEYTRYSDKYSELLDRHKRLRKEHEELQRNYKRKNEYSGPEYWFSLILNPNRGNIIIATNGFEKYAEYNSEMMSATMYGDGRIDASYSGRRYEYTKINRAPETQEEVEFFFGEERASQLWAYWEFYRDFRDFVEGRDTGKEDGAKKPVDMSPETNTREPVSRNYFIDLPYPENLSLPQQHQWYRSQGYNAWLVSRPDFNEFNKWYMRYIKAKGAITSQVGFSLYSYVEKHGGDFSLVRKVLSNWYKKFQLERHGETERK